jgi:hypothetical protein
MYIYVMALFAGIVVMTIPEFRVRYLDLYVSVDEAAEWRCSMWWALRSVAVLLPLVFIVVHMTYRVATKQK